MGGCTPTLRVPSAGRIVPYRAGGVPSYEDWRWVGGGVSWDPWRRAVYLSSRSLSPRTSLSLRIVLAPRAPEPGGGVPVDFRGSGGGGVPVVEVAGENWGMGERRWAGALRIVDTVWGRARWSQAATIAAWCSLSISGASSGRGARQHPGHPGLFGSCVPGGGGYSRAHLQKPHPFIVGTPVLRK